MTTQNGSPFIQHETKPVYIKEFLTGAVCDNLYDLGMAAVGCCAQNKKFSMDRVKQLMKGYEQVCPLTGPEKKQLKIFMEYAAVAASFWRFRQYNLRHPSPDKKNNYLELSCLADQVHAMEEYQFSDIFRGCPP